MKRVSYRTMLLITLLLTAAASQVAAQSVPQGIHYQAVARDNTGKEMSDRTIDVRFSIISGTPLGPMVYQELHQAVRTTRYGVFTLMIGSGIPTGGTVGELSQITWGAAAHYLKVEVKFLSDFSDMGTMQFLSVPYALFAAKSLEPGPAGPVGPVGPAGQQGVQGPPGDPASDKQVLSFEGTNLTITGNPGNTVNLSALINDADANPTNEIQYLSLKGDTLSITQGNFVTFATLDIDDADADPTNEIQDLRLTGNILKITRNGEATEIDLTKYLDNTDEQVLTWNPATRVLGLTNSGFTIDLSRSLSFDTGTNILSMAGGNTVDLTPLKNDADSNPTNEIQDLNLTGDVLKITNNASASNINLGVYRDNTDNQTLTYNPSTYNLSVSGGNTVSLGSMVAFRAGIATSFDLPNNTPTSLIFNQVTGGNLYNDGGYNSSNGVFKAPVAGIYSFGVSLNLMASSSSIILYLDGAPYETIIGPTGSAGQFRGTIVLKLNEDSEVNLYITQTNGFPIPAYSISGTFSGFRVY
jgi:hypothetical protein